MFCLLVVLLKLSLLAKWLARESPLRKLNCGLKTDSQIHIIVDFSHSLDCKLLRLLLDFLHSLIFLFQFLCCHLWQGLAPARQILCAIAIPYGRTTWNSLPPALQIWEIFIDTLWKDWKFFSLKLSFVVLANLHSVSTFYHCRCQLRRLHKLTIALDTLQWYTPCCRSQLISTWKSYWVKWWWKWRMWKKLVRRRRRKVMLQRRGHRWSHRVPASLTLTLVSCRLIDSDMLRYVVLL